MNIEELHSKSMGLADQAFIKKFNGDINGAKVLFYKAFELEKTAAYLAKQLNIGEPTLSVLLKSAASLAINSDELTEAEKLICLALYGTPPLIVAEELRILLEELYFQRHLQLQNITLNTSELQVVIAGRGIGYGMAKSNLVFDKINTFEKLTYRTVERKSGKKFRSSGDVAKVIKMNFQPYLSTPRAASFAFTIRLGENLPQLKLIKVDNAGDIIEDMLNNIELVNIADYETLKENITDDTYYENFISLTKELAPDGTDINLIGLSIIREGKQRDVEFTRTRNNIKNISSDEVNSENFNKEAVELTGRIFAANEEQNNIKLKVKNTTFPILVPEGLGDIVRKYWGEQVHIKGFKQQQKNVIKLSDIEPA